MSRLKDKVVAILDTSDKTTLVGTALFLKHMAAMHDLGLEHVKVNVNGGACALGHPVGATGARIVATLIHALHTRGLKRGVAALCIGGGEATAVAIERL